MTYFELVKAIQDLCEQHLQVQSYGYGNISNLETPLVNPGKNYPYVFLNPTQHQIGEGIARLRFNLIVMDLAGEDFRDNYNDETGLGRADVTLYGEDFVLQAQSDCLQIITDILSALRYDTPLSDVTDVTLQVSVTPFEERFNDTVAGMTATIEVILPNTLNFCIAPF